MPLGNEFNLTRLFSLWRLNRKGVLWRHDIDNHLEHAVRMASMELAAGIHAIYYLHAETPEYDRTSERFHEVIEHVLTCGHEVGTHVDLKVPRHETISDEWLIEACEKQVETLAAWPVGRRISFHRPPQDVVWRHIPGFEHALSPFWRNRYSSDSRYRFRTNPEDLLRGSGHVQINLHPCWWFLDPEEAERLRDQHVMAAEH